MRVVGERPHPGHAQATRDEQQVPAARIDLEAATQRAEHLDAVARAHPRQHIGALAGHPEVDGDLARRPVDGVDAERPSKHEAAVVGRPDVDELAGLGASRQPRCAIALEPLAGQELAGLDELGVEQLHGRGLRPTRPAGTDRQAGLSSSVVSVSAVGVLALIRRDLRVLLGERLGEVAEQVGRVVELDQLLGALEASPTGPRPRPPRRARG